MDFPRLVFKCPGPHAYAGGTYDHKLVKSIDQFDAANSEGWFATLPEAIEGKVSGQDEAAPKAAHADPAPEAATDDAPPTRAEMKQKAQELGLTFANNIPTEKLAELIATKMLQE